MATSNALQKVFRARFEDSRAHVSLTQFSTLSTLQPFLNYDRTNYETLIGKTKRSIFNLIHYCPRLIDLPTSLNTLNMILNQSYFTFPFLVGNKSDMSRYLWFDWYGK